MTSRFITWRFAISALVLSEFPAQGQGYMSSINFDDLGTTPQWITEQYANLGVHFVASSPGYWPSLLSNDIVPTSGTSCAQMAGGAQAWIAFDRPISYFSVDMAILDPASNPTLQLGAIDVGRGVSVFDSTVRPSGSRVWTQISMPSAPLGTDVTKIELYGFNAVGGFANPTSYLFDTMKFAFVPEPSTLALTCLGLLGLVIARRFKLGE